MFNTLASYLLGSSSVKSPTDTEPIAENQSINNSISDDQEEDHQQQAVKFNLITTNCADEEEDDWLLVDCEGEGSSSPQTDSEEEIPFVEIKNNPIIRTRHSRNNSAAGSQDGAFSLLPSSPVPNSMDESWYVTPPPCFTSTGPVNVETSPLENLLIEHPSMSVYHSIRSMQQSSEEDDSVEQDGMVILALDRIIPSLPAIHPALDRISGHTARVARPRSDNHHHHVDHMSVQQVRQVVALKQSQKMNEKRNRQQMCRNAIERQNKVREVNCKGGRQKRSDMTHCKVISRANNNRKC